MFRSRPQRGVIGPVLIASLIAVALALPTPAGAVTAVTAVSLTSSVNPSGYGQAVVLRGVVSDPTTPKAQLTGSMTFSDGSMVLGTKAVTNGAASLTTRALSAGDHAIIASFIPSGGGAAFESTPLAQHVNLGATTTTLTTTRAVSYNGQAGDVSARVKGVAPAFGTPTGSVDFFVDGSWYWTSSVDATGKALLAYADLAPGTYVITATYSGDPNFDASSSAGALTQTILPNAPTAGLTFTPSIVTVGGTSRLVVSATNNGPVSMPNVALGVLLPPLPVGIVSQPPGVGCRRALGNLLYCMVSLPRGATRTLVLSVTGTVSGVYTANSYARNTDTSDETYATATLTVQ